MLELGVALLSLSVALHYGAGWRRYGSAHLAAPVLALLVVASACLLWGSRGHRDWLGVTLVALALPGVIGLGILVQKGLHEWERVVHALKQRPPTRLGR